MQEEKGEIVNVKNPVIEIERFIACTGIFFFHHGLCFTSGWIFVEFFYILTGFLSMKHLKEKIVGGQSKLEDRTCANEICFYTLQKFMQLLPFIVISLGIDAIFNVVDGRVHGIKQMAVYGIILFENIFHLTGYGVLQKKVGINEGFSYNWMLDGIFWFTAALFVALPIFLLMAYKLEMHVGIWLYTACPALLYGWMIMRYGSFSGWPTDDDWIYFALNLRALAGLLVGGGIFVLSLQIKKTMDLSGLKGKIVFLLGIGSFVAATVLGTTRGIPLDYLIVLLFAFNLIVLNVIKMKYLRIINKFAYEIGGIAMPVFCLQYPVYNMFNRLLHFDANYFETIMGYIILVLVSWLLVKLISRPWNYVVGHVIGFLERLLLGNA